MKEININGQLFDEEKVKFKGKQRYKKRDRALRIVGGILAGLGIVLVAYAIGSGKEEYKEIGLILALAGMAIVGAILLVISFLPKDYVKSGIAAIEDEMTNAKKSNPVQASTKVEQKSAPEKIEPVINPVPGVKHKKINPDRTIDVGDANRTQVQIQSDAMLFKFARKDFETKIYDPNDIVSCEIMVDDEMVLNTKNTSSDTKMGFDGKYIGEGISSIGGVLSKFGVTSKYGAAVKAAGTAVKGADVSRKSTKHVTEERKGVVHKYTFIIRLNDLKFPSFVASNIALEKMEDLGNTFAILLANKTEGVGSSKVVKEHTIVDLNEEEKESEQLSEPKVETLPEPEPESIKTIETKQESSVDKFAEIRKYKELLNEGIITQEEFEQKKKELL